MFTKDESVRKVVIIADDLTGAADTGVQFAKQGLTTLVLIEGTHRAGAPVDAAQVLALNTNTRDSDRRQAYKIVYDVARVLKKKGVRYIYKKVDSMLRGNVGAEIEAVMDATGIKTALLAPCFPSQGRITVGGYHLVNQVPLQCTEAVRDLKSPVEEESYLPNLVQAQSKRKVGHVSLCIVIRGPYALREALIEHQKGGDEIIVIDAVTQDHLSTIANAIVAMEMSAIAVGSAGLAGELASFVNPGKKGGRERIVKKDGSVVVICGTKSKVTMQQIEKLGQELDVYIVDVELEPILKDEHRFDEKIRVEVEKIKRSLSIGKNIVVKVKTPDTLDFHVWSRREQRSLTKAIERILGEITYRVIKDSEEKIAGLVLTGGDTAVSVCKRLGSWGIFLKEEVLPGIPAGKLMGGRFEGINVITKAGAFGQKDTLVKLVRYLCPGNNKSLGLIKGEEV